MIKISRKVMLALEAVMDVALYARPHPVSAERITKRHGVAKRHLEQVMQNLVRAEILKSVRGARGGYSLARERRRITVGDIVRAVGEDALNEKNARGLDLEDFWKTLEKDLMRRLDKLTIEEISKDFSKNFKDTQKGSAEEKREMEFHI